MSETLVLKAQQRQTTGTRAARILRKEGKVPVTVYGHKSQPLSIGLSLRDLTIELHQQHRLLDVEIDGAIEKLLVKAVQYDHLGDQVIHVDLTRVDLNERVTVEIEVVLRGTAVGVNDGGVMDHVTNTVQVECPVTAIPENVRISVEALGIGDNLTADQLELPDGVTLMSAPETVLAAVHVMAEEVEEPTEEGEEASAEPEVIGGKPDEEETTDK